MVAFCAAIVLFLFLLPSNDNVQQSTNSNGELVVGQRYQIALPEQGKPSSSSNIQLSKEQATLLISQQIQNSTDKHKIGEVSDSTAQLNWQSIKVKSGDSLAKIFKRNGLNATTTHNVITAKGKESKILKRINVGDTLRIGKDKDGTLVSLEYPFSKTETLFVDLQNKQYYSHKETKSVEIREAVAQGIIQSNFWNTASSAGLNDGQIINLANIFGWDIDFAMDIRKGDTFNVIYENKYIEGEFIGTGKILAAEFINQNDTFQAIRFTDDNYYTPSGKSMRKAFLRAPVNFKYISSNFKPRRFHPVQKRWKAHRGTDYAAKTGTPVVAAGNGKVIRAKYDKYNGHHVFIEHGSGIVTKYLHFSKRKAKKGQRVKQGQVIGYVGSTGLAAGPHLHYEFLLNGVHRNPRTVKLPEANPISKKYRKAFKTLAAQRLTELSGSRQALLSMQDTSQHSD